VYQTEQRIKKLEEEVNAEGDDITIEKLSLETLKPFFEFIINKEPEEATPAILQVLEKELRRRHLSEYLVQEIVREVQAGGTRNRD